MQQRGIVAAVAALALASASGGCGSSSPALTSAELTSQANAICTRRAAEIAAASRHHAGHVRAAMAAAVPVTTKSLDALHALKPPSEIKAAYGRFVAIEEFYTAQFKQAAEGHKAPDSRVRAHELTRLAGELGLTACG